MPKKADTKKTTAIKTVNKKNSIKKRIDKKYVYSHTFFIDSINNLV